MAKKKTPELLREQAKRMMLKANLVEKDNNAKLGIAIREIAENGFCITYEELQMKIYELAGIENKLSTENRHGELIPDNDSSSSAEKLSK